MSKVRVKQLTPPTERKKVERKVKKMEEKLIGTYMSLTRYNDQRKAGYLNIYFNFFLVTLCPLLICKQLIPAVFPSLCVHALETKNQNQFMKLPQIPTLMHSSNVPFWCPERSISITEQTQAYFHS